MNVKAYFRKSILFIAMAVLGPATSLHAQTNYSTQNAKGDDMKLSGTSTLHKWSMDAHTFTGQAQFYFKPGAATLSALKALSFSLAVQNLKSGESGLDKNAYKALKTGTYKNINYNLTSATVSSVAGNKYFVKANGTLTIAGVTKPVAMNVYCTVNADASITCTGSDKLNMTDYQVKPPTFMAGAMKTGDAVDLAFTIVYKKS
jgi:polyisoprenoid-binding protein YceI